MAKIDWVEAALVRWAAAVVEGGGDGSGYPVMSVLHPEWSPPSPGQTPTLKTVRSSGDVRRVHAAIGLLTLRQRNTVVVHYCRRLSLAEQGALLGCEADTVTKRVGEIHRTLASALASD